MATERHADGTHLDLGSISLPVMACVLAAILLTTQFSTPPPHVEPEDEQRLDRLEPEIDSVQKRAEVVKAAVQEALLSLDETGNLGSRLMRLDVELVRLAQERDMLERNVTAAQERAALEAKIAASTAEAATLSNAVAVARSQSTTISNRIELVGMDEFPRPYVVVDCRAKDLLVHAPGLSPRTIQPPLGENEELRGTELDWLRSRVVAARAVVVFGRTASFKSTYWKAVSAVLQVQDDEEKKDKEVAVSLVPLQDHEDISAYVLLGANP